MNRNVKWVKNCTSCTQFILVVEKKDIATYFPTKFLLS
jgi:hypothetical protein